MPKREKDQELEEKTADQVETLEEPQATTIAAGPDVQAGDPGSRAQGGSLARMGRAEHAIKVAAGQLLNAKRSGGTDAEFRELAESLLRQFAGLR